MFSKCFSAFLFFMTFNVVLSDSPIREQIAEDGPLLERVARLEVKMEFVEKEIDLVKDVIADSVAEIKTVLDPFNGKLRGHVFNNTNGGNRDIPRIAFTAYTPAEKSLTSGRAVVFKRVLFNEGNGYSPSTGVFTAPADGLYLFSVHVCNAEGSHVAYGIVHDGTYIAYSVQYQRPSQGSSCSSVNALRMMRVGQKVLVKTTHATVFQEDGFRRATFMGVLLR